jgi:hypothetical protein
MFSIGKKKSWKDMKVLLIVSTGRTGTKFFGHFFEKVFASANCYHEPKPDISSIGPDFIARRLSASQAINEVLAKRKSFLQKNYDDGKSFYVESNGAYSFLLPVVKEIFPNVAVVHIVREPFDWIKSAFSRPVEKSGKVIPKYSIDANWKVTSQDVPGRSFSVEWDSASLKERLAWMWTIKNDLILENKNKVDHFLSVRFEDIFDVQRGAPGLSQIMHFLISECGFPIERTDYTSLLKDRSNETKNFLTEDAAAWSDEETQRIAAITRPIAALYY